MAGRRSNPPAYRPSASRRTAARSPIRSLPSSPNGRGTALLAIAAAIVLATVAGFWLMAPGVGGTVIDDDPDRVVHQPRSFGDVAEYPSDYPTDAPRLTGTLLEATSATPATGGPAGGDPAGGDPATDPPSTDDRATDAPAATPTWSLRYARQDYTPEAAIGELTSRGYGETGRATDAAGLMTVTLESEGGYSVALEWSDTQNQTQLDMIVRPSR